MNKNVHVNVSRIVIKYGRNFIVLSKTIGHAEGRAVKGSNVPKSAELPRRPCVNRAEPPVRNAVKIAGHQQRVSRKRLEVRLKN